MTARVAVCWDLDGTVLRGGAVGGEVLRRAFATVTGLTAPDGSSWAGSPTGWWPTPTATCCRPPPRPRCTPAATSTGRPSPTPSRPSGRAATTSSPRRCASCRGRRDAGGAGRRTGRHPGRRHRQRPRGRQAKLRAAGLADAPLDLDRGAFGHIPGPRENLVHHARAALEAHHGGPVLLVVVGDTPRDVEAAHAGGAVAVGVATGPGPESTVASLRAAGPSTCSTTCPTPDAWWRWSAPAVRIRTRPAEGACSRWPPTRVSPTGPTPQEALWPATSSTSSPATT